MSKVLAITISTICTWLLIVNLNKKTEVVNTNLTNDLKNKIKISEYLSPMMNSNKKIRYKYLYENSLGGNLSSLKELIAFSCGGGSRCYGHGMLIFEIVEQIGEEPFIKIIPSMSEEERSWLESLWLSRTYGDNFF
jgi:hypothetical protein